MRESEGNCCCRALSVRLWCETILHSCAEVLTELRRDSRVIHRTKQVARPLCHPSRSGSAHRREHDEGRRRERKSKKGKEREAAAPSLAVAAPPTNGCVGRFWLVTGRRPQQASWKLQLRSKLNGQCRERERLVKGDLDAICHPKATRCCRTGCATRARSKGLLMTGRAFPGITSGGFCGLVWRD